MHIKISTVSCTYIYCELFDWQLCEDPLVDLCDVTLHIVIYTEGIAPADVVLNCAPSAVLSASPHCVI